MLLFSSETIWNYFVNILLYVTILLLYATYTETVEIFDLVTSDCFTTKKQHHY
jgi:hypothetical protein